MSLADIAKREPVIVSGTVAGALGWAGSFLVLHGIVSNTVASATVQEVTPSVVAFVLLAISAIVRNFVIPAAVKAESFVAKEVDKYVPALDEEVKAASSAVNEALAALDDNSVTRVLPKVTGSAPVPGA
jgi:hypothetical protein